MLHYELMAIFDADLEDKSVEASSKKIQSLIAKNNGKVEKVDQLGRRRLAYEIDHKREGNYTVYYFQGDAAAVKELDRVLRITDEVIRYRIYRRPEVKMTAGR